MATWSEVFSKGVWASNTQNTIEYISASLSTGPTERECLIEIRASGPAVEDSAATIEISYELNSSGTWTPYLPPAIETTGSVRSKVRITGSELSMCNVLTALKVPPTGVGTSNWLLDDTGVDQLTTDATTPDNLTAD